MSATCQGCGTPISPPPSGGWRKWCSERCRKGSYGDPCVDCGARTSFGSEKARVPEPRCRECAATVTADEWRGYRHLVESMWAEGMTSRQIADALGWKMKCPATHIVNLRNQHGYNLPYRRTPEQLARLRAGSEERMAKARAVYRAQKAAA